MSAPGTARTAAPPRGRRAAAVAPEPHRRGRAATGWTTLLRFVLRRDRVDHQHFRTRTWLAVLGALTCAYLAGPWARSAEQQEQYVIAGALVGLGILLSFVTWLYNRSVRHRQIAFSDVSRLEDEVPDDSDDDGRSR